ncbi:hypothetical protein [Streptomyces albogriseolus]|uniref:hypothetical protein n=1 Tax=Streptomyces albogriseolus TaxID=1887 RepID=UPI003F540CC5
MQTSPRGDSSSWLTRKNKASGGTTISNGGYRGTVLIILNRCLQRQPLRLEEGAATHMQVRARVEHVLTRMKIWKLRRDCRLNGDGVHTTMLGIARLHSPHQDA